MTLNSFTTYCWTSGSFPLWKWPLRNWFQCPSSASLRVFARCCRNCLEKNWPELLSWFSRMWRSVSNVSKSWSIQSCSRSLTLCWKVTSKTRSFWSRSVTLAQFSRTTLRSSAILTSIKKKSIMMSWSGALSTLNVSGEKMPWSLSRTISNSSKNSEKFFKVAMKRMSPLPVMIWESSADSILREESNYSFIQCDWRPPHQRTHHGEG